MRTGRHPRAARLAALLWLGAAGGAAAADEPRGEAKARIHDIEQDLNDWDIPEAKRELAELEKLVSADLEPLSYFRGRIAFEEGRYDEAVRLFKAAGVEDKAGSYLRLAADTAKVVGDHPQAASEHFVFFYPPGKDEILAPWALETLEAQRAALSKAFGHEPPGKVRVEVVNDAAQLAKVSTLTLEEINTTGTIAICKFNKLIITSPKSVARGYDWLDTLAHEYTHLVVTQKSHNTVPIWLHEGIAKYFESAWRAAPGLALTPSNLALLGQRVRKDKLVPFEKMHPSIALLPNAEDAATAFAEVFLAVDYLYRAHGDAGIRQVIDALARGKSDRAAVEQATGMSFPAFEKAWLAYVKKQPFPKDLIPHDYESPQALAERLKQGGKQGKERAGEKAAEKGREISFGDFTEVEEPEARKLAHLGELFRERSRLAAAAEEYGRAHALVGDKYESVSNKLALTLLDLKRSEEAEQVLLGSLKLHPGAPATHVHLGRIYLAQRNFPKAKDAYLGALAADPFDEEIHVALAGIYEALSDKPMAERARKASALLTGLTPEKVGEMAKRLSRPEPEAPQGRPAAPARKAVEAKGPSRGPADATVTVVEFSDFQCPYCRRTRDTLDQVLLAYPGKVRLVFRQFPLEFHERAEAAAEAALCANEQGKFWPYHDALFTGPGHLSRQDFLEYAGAVGLDGRKFTQCLDSGRAAAQVKEDLAAGEKLQITGTPALFVNGIPLSGALPLSELKRVIDAELGAN